jgi:hypothetical protein
MYFKLIKVTGGGDSLYSFYAAKAHKPEKLTSRMN